MNACIENNTYFTKTIVSLAGMVDLANVECRQQGLTISAMDSQGVCLISMHLHAGGVSIL